MSSVRIVILNYDGEEILKRCLPSVVEAAKKSKRQVIVSILDNQSRDQGLAWVRKNWPQVEVTSALQNLVYCSYNDYFKKVTEPYVIILNNDIKVDESFIDPLIDILDQDPASFLASSQCKNVETGSYEGSLSKLELKYGLIWGSSIFPGVDEKSKHRHRTMQAGFGAFRREMILKLGGFDTLYLPGTVEDTDLCFRAYRQGWHAIYEPASIVYHYGQVSFKKTFGAKKLRRLNRRNMYLFMWKNIRDPKFIFIHVLSIPMHLLKYGIKGEFEFLLGFWDALKKIPLALKRRTATQNEKSVLSDQEIFHLSRTI